MDQKAVSTEKELRAGDWDETAFSHTGNPQVGWSLLRRAR
jgi:hypothetical protein